MWLTQRTRQIYDNVYKTVGTLYQQILATLDAQEIRPNEIQAAQLDGISAINTLPWSRSELVSISSTEAVVASGSGQMITLSQFTTESAKNKVTAKELSPGVFQLENDHLSVKIEKGCITSLYDRRARRETLSGKANQYVIFDDKPVYWQAWDVEVYHLETREELQNDSDSTTRLVEDNGFRASVVFETKISEVSSIKTTISLSAVLDDAQPSQVECMAEVDWHETMRFLKVEFPVSVSNMEASYETQYGVIRRPTHYNTS